MRMSADSRILLILFIVLCIGGFLLARPGMDKENKISSVNNADPKGVKAFYTLLDRFGYSTGKLIEPYNKIPADARIVFVVQPTEEIEDEEVHYLKKWVDAGGVVVFLSNGLKGVPAKFGFNQNMGKGRVYAFKSRRVITNLGMRDHKNGLKMLEIIDRHGGRNAGVLFDEYHHGETAGVIVLSRQVKAAMWMAGFAVLILCYSYGRRFGAVRSLPAAETLRPSYEFVESVARLYQRARAADLAAEILQDSFRQSVCARLGLPSDAPSELVVHQIGQARGNDVASRVDSLLSSVEGRRGGQKPSEAELVRIATEVRSLEKELGLGIYAN